MTFKILRAIIMGPPGSGKGTISTRIVKDFTIFHLSSGDLLRSQIWHKTGSGLAAKKFIDEGKLVPDEMMISIITTELRKYQGKNWLLDGFPRTVAQAEALHDQQPVDIVMNLNVPDSVIINRISGRWTHAPSGRVYHTEFHPPQVAGKDDITGDFLVQRDDDTAEVVKKRLETYYELTRPLLDYYKNHGVLKEFKGNYSNEIWPHVHKYLSTKMHPNHYTEYY